MLALAMIVAGCAQGGDDGDEVSETEAQGDAADTVEEATDVADDDATPAATPTTGGAGSEACEQTTGVTDSAITLGQSMGLSGAMQALADSFLAGFDTYIDAVNADGGVGGRQLEILRVDNEFSPEPSVQRFEEIEPEVAMLTSQGSAATNAILEDIAASCLPTLIFGNAGVNALDEHTYLYATPYAYHALNIFEWAVEEQDATGPWGIIHSSDALGDEVLQATRFAAEFHGVDLAVETSFQYPTDQDFSGQIRQMMDAGVEWVMLGALPPSSVGIVGQAQAAGADFNWVSPQTASSGETDFSTTAGELFDEVDLYLASCCSGWNSSDAPGLVEAKEAISAASDAEGFLPLLGYIWARLMVEVVQQADSAGDLSRGGLTRAIGELGEVDTGGLTCNYVFGEEGQPNNPTRASMIMQIDSTNPPDGFVQVADCFVSDAAAEFQLAELLD